MNKHLLIPYGCVENSADPRAAYSVKFGSQNVSPWLSGSERGDSRPVLLTVH